MVGIKIFSYRSNISLTLALNSSSINVPKSLVVVKLLTLIPPPFFYTIFYLNLNRKSLVIIANHHLSAHGGNDNGL